MKSQLGTATRLSVKKLDAIDQLDADLLVVRECENPADPSERHSHTLSRVSPSDARQALSNVRSSSLIFISAVLDAVRSSLSAVMLL